MAQTLSLASANATSYYTHEILPRQNRNTALRDFLYSSKANWDDLGKAVIDFQPDIVILLARKMPRIYGALSWNFYGALVVSDFALPFIAHKITDKIRIAIIDDSINQGSTLKGLCKRVAACGALFENMKIFAMGDRDKERKNFQIQMGENSSDAVTVAHKTLMLFDPDAEYKKFSDNLGSAAGMFALPYEIEFPIFETEYVNKNLNSEEILQQLRTTFNESANVHDTSVKQSSEYGLARFSIDMYPEVCKNFKIRLYLDDIEKTIAIVPMAVDYTNGLSSEKNKNIKSSFNKILKNVNSNKEVFVGESRKRVDTFLSSLEFLYAEFYKLRTFFAADKLKIRKQDMSMLFGNDIANIIEQNIEYKKFFTPKFDNNDSQIKKSEDKITHSKFFSVCFDENNNPTEFLRSFKFYDIKTREGIFIKFFEHLSRYVSAEPESKNNDPKWSFDEDCKELSAKSEIENNDYLRLRIGPTFDDMISIFEYLWKNTFEEKKVDRQECRRLLSDILDTSIDCGGIVPVIGKGLQRCFRKGEATAYDKNVYYAYRWLYYLDGKSIDDIPTDPSKFNKNDLSPHMQIRHDTFLKQLHNVEI